MWEGPHIDVPFEMTTAKSVFIVLEQLDEVAQFILVLASGKALEKFILLSLGHMLVKNELSDKINPLVILFPTSLLIRSIRLLIMFASC